MSYSEPGGAPPPTNPVAVPTPKKDNGNGKVAVILALVLVIVIGVFAVISFNPGPNGVSAAPAGCDNAAATDYQVSVAEGANVVSVVKKGTAPSVAVDVYFDYMCPYCGQFERANQLDLEAFLEAGSITLNLHVMSFLDEASEGSQYSTRAANAALVVATKAPAAFLAFNEAMFANQQSEGTTGLSDEDIALLARRAGVSDAVAKTLATGEFTPAIAQSTQQDFQVISGTPTVLLNGVKFEGGLYSKGELKKAIAAMI